MEERKVEEEDGTGTLKLTLHDQPLLTGAILTAVLVILFTFLYYFLINRKQGKGILFVGASETGKTSLFTHLLNKSSGGGAETVTSTVPNIGEYKSDNGKGSLILKDLPGHDRVRNKWFDMHKAGVRGIVCVVDSAGGSKSIRDTAEVLYSVLTDSTVKRSKPRLLILANKQDLLLSKGERVIKSQLEKEITTLRLTKSASLETTGGKNTGGAKLLGKQNVDFEFEHVSPIKVDYGKSCGKPNESDLKDLLNWLDSVA